MVDAGLDVAIVEIHDRHGGGEPRRVVLTASEFDAMATDVPMAQLQGLLQSLPGKVASLQRPA